MLIMENQQFPPWPIYAADEIAAVTKVLESGRVNYWSGQEGRKFEREFASYHGVSHAVAVANGTVALDLALYALGIGPGDEVVVTPRTFLASASCIVNAGARPVFADVDRDSGNITPDTVRAVLTPRTRAVVTVHLAGWPCEMDGILDLARDHDLFVIEDCAQAHGARYKGRHAGSMGHVGAFSFCTDKIISTGGEGGMVITDDHDFWHRMWSYKDHGKSWDAVYNREHPAGFRWLHESFGTNLRLTEMQSALGRIQLGKLDHWLQRRRENAQVLVNAFSHCRGLRVPIPGQEIDHAWYKFYAFVRPEELKPGWSRDRIVQVLNDMGIPCLHGGCSEVYLEKAFDGGLRPEERLPVARELGETSLMFMVHPTLTEKHMKQVADAVREVMARAERS